MLMNFKQNPYFKVKEHLKRCSGQHWNWKKNTSWYCMYIFYGCAIFK